MDKSLNLLLGVGWSHATTAHTACGQLVLAGLLALIFEPPFRLRAFGCCLLGELLHVGADLFQLPSPLYGTRFLSPFDLTIWNLGWFIDTDVVYIIPLSVAILILVERKWHRQSVWA
jgi:hypothetical protein